MRVRVTLASILLVVAASARCGSTSSSSGACSTPINGSCTFRANQQCTEYHGLVPDAAAFLATNCAGYGTWTAGPCDRDGATGGCEQMGQDNCFAVWNHFGSASAQMSMCVGEHYTWINP